MKVTNNFRLPEQEAVITKTANAIKAFTEEAEDGRFDDTLDVLAFLAGYCKNEPVLIEEIYAAVRELQRREILGR